MHTLCQSERGLVRCHHFPPRVQKANGARLCVFCRQVQATDFAWALNSERQPAGTTATTRGSQLPTACERAATDSVLHVALLLHSHRAFVRPCVVHPRLATGFNSTMSRSERCPCERHAGWRRRCAKQGEARKGHKGTGTGEGRKCSACCVAFTQLLLTNNARPCGAHVAMSVA